jgi:hypothetical protein
MRVKRHHADGNADGNLDAERSRKRRKTPKRGGVPKLGLWECGIGSGWK